MASCQLEMQDCDFSFDIIFRLLPRLEQMICGDLLIEQFSQHSACSNCRNRVEAQWSEVSVFINLKLLYLNTGCFVDGHT